MHPFFTVLQENQYLSHPPRPSLNIAINVIPIFSIYDIDSNALIDQDEMTQIVKYIHKMTGFKPEETELGSTERIVEHVFKKVDCNSDGIVTIKEFIGRCIDDDEIDLFLSLIKFNHCCTSI